MCPINTLKRYAMLSNWKIVDYAKSTLILLISTLPTGNFRRVCIEEKLHWDIYSLRLLCVLFDVCRAVPGNFCEVGRENSGDYNLLHDAQYSKGFLVGCIGIESICIEIDIM